jgi:hypothetical protein
MPLPTKKEDLEEIGYVFDNEARCRFCDEPIEWWITSNGKKMPMTVVDVKSEGFPSKLLRVERRPHFPDCEPYQEMLKKQKKTNG